MATTATREQVRVHIRWMIRSDLPAVLATEDASFREPWGDEDVLRQLRQRNCIGVVAEVGERVIGHMVYELYEDHIGVCRLAVDPDHRRRGVGRQLVAKLLGKLSTPRRPACTLYVGERNMPALLFFRRLGFLADRVERAYYEDGDDAIVMTYRLAAY